MEFIEQAKRYLLPKSWIVFGVYFVGMLSLFLANVLINYADVLQHSISGIVFNYGSISQIPTLMKFMLIVYLVGTFIHAYYNHGLAPYMVMMGVFGAIDLMVLVSTTTLPAYIVPHSYEYLFFALLYVSGAVSTMLYAAPPYIIGYLLLSITKTRRGGEYARRIRERVDVYLDPVRDRVQQNKAVFGLVLLVLVAGFAGVQFADPFQSPPEAPSESVGDVDDPKEQLQIAVQATEATSHERNIESIRVDREENKLITDLDGVSADSLHTNSTEEFEGPGVYRLSHETQEWELDFDGEAVSYYGNDAGFWVITSVPTLANATKSYPSTIKNPVVSYNTVFSEEFVEQSSVTQLDESGETLTLVVESEELRTVVWIDTTTDRITQTAQAFRDRDEYEGTTGITRGITRVTVEVPSDGVEIQQRPEKDLWRVIIAKLL